LERDQNASWETDAGTFMKLQKAKMHSKTRSREENVGLGITKREPAATKEQTTGTCMMMRRSESQIF